MKNIYFRDSNAKSRFEKENPGSLAGMTPYQGYVLGAPRWPHDELNGVYTPKGIEGLEAHRAHVCALNGQPGRPAV